MTAQQVTIITGAGSGIGLASARHLAGCGHTLLLVGRTLATLEAARAQCAGAGAACAAGLPAPRIEVLACDVGVAAQARMVVPFALERLGGLDTVVNCAGIAESAPIDATTDALMDRAFRTNTFGPATIIRAAWPHFAARRAGCIVNVSSYATVSPFPGLFAYAASKSALDSMTRSCHVEGEPLGIRAFCINPGAVETPMLRALFSEDAVPRATTLDPGEVARVIVDCIEGRRDADRGSPVLLRRQ